MTDLRILPKEVAEEDEEPDRGPEEIISFMKDSLRSNPRESRVVHVSKPHMDEKTNKVSLLEMKKSDVLGLETSKEDDSKATSFYIRKPPKMTLDRSDPFGLKEGDQMVLGFSTQVSSDLPTEYYDMLSEVTRIGTENMTVQSAGHLRREAGMPVEMDNFGVGGVKTESSDELLTYLIGEDHLNMTVEEKVEELETQCYLLNFYTKLRFNRETSIYEPEIPMRIQILSKIVRAELSRPKEEGEQPEIAGLGMKFYYDPQEYSRDSFSYDKWELIRDFKENAHFREIHKSLNGLIGFLENQSR